MGRSVLITGAAGLFGGILRSHWQDRYDLKLADIQPIEDVASHETFVEMDIREVDAFVDVCRGVDTVVHLAAFPGGRAEFYDTLLELNIIGCYNAFHAAHTAGCRRLVFASTIDVVGGYAEEEDVPWDEPVCPTTVYGATKCWGEALGRVYAHSHGLSCICGLVQGGLRPTVFEVPLPLAVPDFPHRCGPDQVVDVPVSGLVTSQVPADSCGQATWTERATDIDIPTF